MTVTNGTNIEYISSSGINLRITEWDNNSQPTSASNLVDFGSGHPGNNVVASDRVSSFTFYPVDSSLQRISNGQVFQYIINFYNGQSVSGSLIAQ